MTLEPTQDQVITALERAIERAHPADARILAALIISLTPTPVLGRVKCTPPKKPLAEVLRETA